MAMSATGSGNRAPDRARGSTLIELLVGLAIASVLLGAATLAFPRTDARRAEQAAARAQALVALACERAELSGEDIGIAVEQDRLVFGRYGDGAWRVFADAPHEALRPRRLDPAVTLELRVEAPLPALPDDGAPGAQALCLAGGGLTPFVLELHGPARRHWSLHGDSSGALRREDGNAR